MIAPRTIKGKVPDDAKELAGMPETLEFCHQLHQLVDELNKEGEEREFVVEWYYQYRKNSPMLMDKAIVSRLDFAPVYDVEGEYCFLREWLAYGRKMGDYEVTRMTGPNLARKSIMRELRRHQKPSVYGDTTYDLSWMSLATFKELCSACCNDGNIIIDEKAQEALISGSARIDTVVRVVEHFDDAGRIVEHFDGADRIVEYFDKIERLLEVSILRGGDGHDLRQFADTIVDVMKKHIEYVFSSFSGYMSIDGTTAMIVIDGNTGYNQHDVGEAILEELNLVELYRWRGRRVWVNRQDHTLTTVLLANRDAITLSVMELNEPLQINLIPKECHERFEIHVADEFPYISYELTNK